MKTKQIKLLVIIASVAVAGIFAFQRSKVSDASDELMIGERMEESGESISSAPVTAPVELTAYICGEVRSPGVYKVGSGARISELVDKAGGMTEDADLTSINLAREVTDGEQIIIGSVKGGQVVSGSEPGSTSGTGDTSTGKLININTADKTALMTLPGIGEVRAEAIISYRDSNGLFKKKEDIKKVSGIKDGSYDKIKDLITV